MSTSAPVSRKQLLVQEMERIRSTCADERLQARVVWETARDNPGHVFRDYFTWDGDEAVEKLGLIQARRLIRRVVSIVIETRERKVYTPHIEVVPRDRFYQSLGADRTNGGGYRPMAEILSRDELREELLQTALGELHALQRRYARLEELAEVWQTVAKVEDKSSKRRPPQKG